MVADTLLRRLAGLNEFMRSTPIVPLEHPAVSLFAKLECVNAFSGSAKDRAAYWVLRKAIERGEIEPTTTIVESSSGNFAVALALMCRRLGLSFIPVIDARCNRSTENLLRRICADVVKIDDDPCGESLLLRRLEAVRRLAKTLPTAFWPDQYNNPDAAEAHFELTAAEICRQIPRLDYMYVGVGTGATICGLSQRLKQHYPAVVIVAVDVEGSQIFGMPPKPRQIPGLGSAMRGRFVDEAKVDEVVVISEPESVQGCHDLLVRHGIFAGGSSGTVYAAIQRHKYWPTASRASVLFLCADRGAPYAETIFNQDWVSTTYPA